MAQHRATEVFYPESDGQPIAESEVHRNLLWDLISALSHWLEGRPDAHVSGSLLVYYVEGQPRHVICPDVFIAFDSHKRLLENYRTWRDGPFPQVVIELTSRSTQAGSVRAAGGDGVLPVRSPLRSGRFRGGG